MYFVFFFLNSILDTVINTHDKKSILIYNIAIDILLQKEGLCHVFSQIDKKLFVIYNNYIKFKKERRGLLSVKLLLELWEEEK